MLCVASCWRACIILIFFACCLLIINTVQQTFLCSVATVIKQVNRLRSTYATSSQLNPLIVCIEAMISSTVVKQASTRLAIVSRAKTAAVSRSSQCRLLTTKTPQKPPSSSPAAATSSQQNNSGSNAIPNEMSNPPDVDVEVTPQMKTANLGLAALLVGFVGGVFYYSMSRVGSQDNSESDDPLAQLKLEAQEAMDKQKKDNTPDQRAQQLLQEFNRGDHDPDKAEVDALEELEAEEKAEKSKKKSWWKFW